MCFPYNWPNYILEYQPRDINMKKYCNYMYNEWNVSLKISNIYFTHACSQVTTENDDKVESSREMPNMLSSPLQMWPRGRSGDYVTRSRTRVEKRHSGNWITNLSLKHTGTHRDSCPWQRTLGWQGSRMGTSWRSSWATGSPGCPDHPTESAVYIQSLKS